MENTSVENLSEDATKAVDMHRAVKILGILIGAKGGFTDEDLSAYGVLTLMNAAQLTARGAGLSEEEVAYIFEASNGTFEGVNIPTVAEVVENSDG